MATSFQSSIPLRPDALGPAGSRAGGPGHKTGTRLNNAQNVAKVTDSTVTVANSTAYTFTAGGVVITYTSDGSALIAEIIAGLEAARLAAAILNGPLSGPAKIAITSGGGNVLRITETDPASGEVVLAEADANLSAFVATTAHAQEQPLDAGIFVAQSGTDGRGIKLPTLVGDKIIGLVEHRHTGVELELADLSATKLYKAFSEVPVGYEGDWVVVPENTGLITDGVYCRYASGAGGTVLGAVRATDTDTTTAVLVAGAEWVTKPVAGTKCILRLNRP